VTTPSSNGTSHLVRQNDWFVRTVQIGKLEEHIFEGKPWTTAIYKMPTDQRVEITKEGLVGDENTGAVRDLDRAICCHPLAHYDFWRSYYRRDIPTGFFGENLTIEGILEETSCVGDIIRCGTAILQITQPRPPCYKQARKMNEPKFVKFILQTGKPGFLTRVLEPGFVQVGDAFELLERPHPEANLAFVQQKRFDPEDKQTALELSQLGPLAHDWKADFKKMAES
jgi:MOSC domain-containing protein YiiM